MLLGEILFTILIMVMMLLKNKTFFDTDYLSSFLRIGRMDLVLDKYGRILISTQVKSELCAEGYSPKIRQGFIDLYNEGHVEIYEIVENTEEWDIYLNLRYESTEDYEKNIGEMSVIALAKAKNGILASNNLNDVCVYVEEYNLEHVTTATTLVECFKNNEITFKEANSYWKKLHGFGIKLPKTSFENFCKLHGYPCEDFKNHKFN